MAAIDRDGPGPPNNRSEVAIQCRVTYGRASPQRLVYLSHVDVSGFGPIDAWSADVLPTGIHCLEASNGAGKTQLLTAIVAAITGPPASFLRIREGGARCRVVVALADDAGQSVLGFEGDAKGLTWEGSPNDSRRRRLLESLANNTGLTLIASSELPPGHEWLDDIVEEICASPRARDLAPPSLAALIDEGEPETWTHGEKLTVVFLYEVVRRMDSAVSLPWLLDCPLAMFRSEIAGMLREWIRKVAERHQVIWLDLQGRSIVRPDGLLVHKLPSLPDVPEKGLAAVSGGYADAAPFSRELVLAKLHARAREQGGSVERQAQEIVDSTDKRRTGASDGEILELLKSNQEVLEQLLHASNSILDSVCDLQEKFAGDLEDALSRHDDIMASQLATQISGDISRQLRKKHGDDIDSELQELAVLHGAVWRQLSTITRKDLALAWRLSRKYPDDAIHLAILQVCRALESEIQTNVFNGYWEHAAETLEHSEMEASKSMEIRPRGFSRSRDELCGFLEHKGPRLTLASFSFILKAVEKCPSVPVFQHFDDWLKNRYSEDAHTLRNLIVHLAMPVNSVEDSLPDAIANIRNRCAHPPSMRDPDDRLLTSETYDAIWKLALQPPVRLLALLVKPRAS